MSQPRDPNNRYDDPQFFVYVPQQHPGPLQDGAPAQYGYRPADPALPAYRPADAYGTARPRSSWLPIYLASALVLLLAIGVTLFLALRDDATTSGGPEPVPDAPSAVDVTKAFLVAVDDQDEPAVKGMSRGEVLEELDEVLSAQDYDIVLASGNLLDDAQKEVGDVEIAVVLWEVVDVPEDLADQETNLAVSLLDEGDGYQVCYVDDADGKSITTLMSQWEDDFAQSCDYAK